MKMKRQIASFLLFFVLLNHSGALASSLDDGLKFYKQEDYLKAQKELEKARLENDKDWRVHYYLGNTYLALGKFESANREYEIAKPFCEDDRNLKLCCMARLAVENYIIRSQVVNSRIHAAGQEAQKNIQMASEAYKNRIKTETERQISFIKNQAKEQIKAEKSCSQQILRFEDGRTTLDIAPSREAEINAETEKQCDILRQTAQKSMDTFR
ncbi:hypothetical protein KA183_16315 [bacterium]|nr:hypothetical protein [bacterium]